MLEGNQQEITGSQHEGVLECWAGEEVTGNQQEEEKRIS